MRFRLSRRVPSALVLFVFIAMPAVPIHAGPILYDVRYIVDTLGDEFIPIALDDTSVFVGGTSSIGGYVSDLGIYTNTSVLSSGPTSRLVAVKNGVAVGQSDNQAVSYTPGSGFTSLMGSYSKAVGIDSSGRVLIQRGEDFPNGVPETYLYENGNTNQIGFDRPVALNDNGYYVGTDFSKSFGFFDDINSLSFTSLSQNGSPIVPTSINNNNIIGGRANNQAIIDVDPFGTTDGIFLGFLNQTDTLSQVIGLNDGDLLSDLLVTFYSEGPDGKHFGLWNPIEGAFDLVDLLNLNDSDLAGISNIEIIAATNPNNQGEIAVAALLDGEHTVMLLTPTAVPEASSLAMAGFALLGSLAYWRSRRMKGA